MYEGCDEIYTGLPIEIVSWLRVWTTHRDLTFMVASTCIIGLLSQHGKVVGEMYTEIDV